MSLQAHPNFKGRERCMAPETSKGGKPGGTATEEAWEDILVVTVARATRIVLTTAAREQARTAVVNVS